MNNQTNAQQLETPDMQGIIRRGYGNLKAAAYLLLRIQDEGAAQAKKYIRYLLKEKLITSAEKEDINPEQKEGNEITQAINIAFTNHGVKKLLSIEALSKFSPEFRFGMDQESRALALGDTDENAPKEWEWGNAKNPVDMLLLFYAKDAVALSALVSHHKTICESFSYQPIKILDTVEISTVANGKIVEHFGFKDAISSPRLTGLPPSKKSNNHPLTKAGEFVLGYENEYNAYSPSPMISADTLNAEHLPLNHRNNSQRDLGKNGTYLVFRQLAQHVVTFWEYMLNNSTETGNTKEEKAIALAAKMVGRWPGGAPLTLSPKRNKARYANATQFDYSTKDKKGYGCPFGAHIRRSNPRDMIEGREPDQSNEITKKHQILRRGRIYGEPLINSMKPVDMLNNLKDDGKERGLHFICLAADIAKQFEFIQTVWANNFTFAGRCNEVDPITGPRPPNADHKCLQFTVNASPLRRNYDNIPQFTTMKGGAYFFLPGINALRFIAT